MTMYREGAPTPVVVLAISDRILGIDPSTGDVRWDYQIQGAGAHPLSLLITPNRIYAACAPALACLEYPTGEPLWTANVPLGRAVLLLEGGRLYVATGAGKLDCFTLDGQHLWQNSLKGKGTGPVALGVPGNVMQADERG
jgi:outer membrane protein assembly factor BamB